MTRAIGYALGYFMGTLVLAVIVLSLGATILYGDPARFSSHTEYAQYKDGINTMALVVAVVIAGVAALIGSQKGADEDARLNRPRP